MSGEDGIWTDELARTYVAGMERNVRYDHRRWAGSIAARLAPIPDGLCVVDVGSGPAFLLLELAPLLPGARLVATDASPVMARLARERAERAGLQIDVRTCRSEALDLPDGSADVVTCKHFLRLSPDRDALLSEVRRVLKPGGRLFVVDFSAEAAAWRAWLLRAWVLATSGRAMGRIFWDSYHATALVPRDLVATLGAAGFSDASVLDDGLSFLAAATRGP